jgi:hypothetical protein
MKSHQYCGRLNNSGSLAMLIAIPAGGAVSIEGAPFDRMAWAGKALCTGSTLAFVKTVYFLRRTTIYDPPKEGLPYLVVTFTSDGLKITAANSSLSARTIASDGVFRRRSERQSEQSKMDRSNVA